jgi:hypothetical protein
MSLTGADLQTLVGRRTGDTTTAGQQMVLDILQGVLEEIYDLHNWPWRIRYGELTTQAPYSTGTITGAIGSTSITGNSTVFTGISGYDSTDDPFFLIVGEEVYRIASINADDGAGAITLKSGLVVAQTAASYAIYRPWVNVAADVKEVLDVLCYPYGELRDWPLKKLVRMFQIMNTGTVPYGYGVVEDGASKVKRIGIYPFMTEVKHLTYVYRAKAPDISSGSVDCGCPDAFRDCLIAGILGEWYANYHDRPDLAQANLALYNKKLAMLQQAAKVHAGPYQKREWGRTRRPRTGFYITQEVEF